MQDGKRRDRLATSKAEVEVVDCNHLNKTETCCRLKYENLISWFDVKYP